MRAGWELLEQHLHFSELFQLCPCLGRTEAQDGNAACVGQPWDLGEMGAVLAALGQSRGMQGGDLQPGAGAVALGRLCPPREGSSQSRISIRGSPGLV